MIALDVNILIDAYRGDAPRHDPIRGWLYDVANGDAPFGVPGIVVSGYLRIVTNPRAFVAPTPLPTAVGHITALLGSASAVRLDPGPRHWEIFRDLCERGRATGNLVPDAYIAAIAVEHGAELVTLDRGFGRFPGLRWREPIEPSG